MNYAYRIVTVLALTLLGSALVAPAQSQARWSVVHRPLPSRLAAYHDVLAAREAALREARRAAAAARVERYRRAWIERWSDTYGANVGRWADEALDVGWPESQMWTLGRIIRAESGGSPGARNSYSDCRGLLQLAPCHWRGRFDPFDARLNLAYGLKLWRGSGWRPWVTY